ncbi:uncharacterized protein KY384_008137 [Bacidia gigantensis]|uniref:uncharacterized protein n=1 Tax=Bacidia gigantensis TaxID=2732470 RepID=UPI001D037924|nr:uncharacterized protein KY384_008137 [Bacidia gigantensis]KAG8526708.1 hypothetical protein KY384_008137 [Bacidia gigantensis]
MTAYATRAPLQLIENPHIMSDAQRQGRRTSSRLAEKEDVIPNGLHHDYGSVKHNQKPSTVGRGTKAATNGKTAMKRKPAYDEEDEGFAFTRTRSKKAKAEPPQPSIAEEQAPKQIEPTTQRQPRKRPEDRSSVGAQVSEPIKSTRRGTRNGSGEQQEEDPPQLAVKKRRKRGSDGSKTSKETQAQLDDGSLKQDLQQDHTQPIQIDSDSTKIALPFADTPIIRRNKQMRRDASSGSRRSSLGMRGRRASSLIDTGKSNALPHEEVESSQFYKHIESEGLSEPRRMKQLLTWCGTRALGEKPSFGDKERDAVLAAREIQSQLLKDFSAKSGLSDWFSRDDAPRAPSPPKPNPKNIANESKIKELEDRLTRLKSEHDAYNELLKPHPLANAVLPPPTSASDPTTLDLSLLPPSQRPHLESLLSSQASSTAPTSSAPRRLQSVLSNLEPTLDTFAVSVHALRSYKEVASDLADNMLEKCTTILEDRDRECVKRANDGEGGEGTREVLRGLSRVLEER